VRHAHGVLTVTESWRPLAGGLFHARYRYRDRTDAGAETAVDATFVARAWDPARVRPFFASCGLSVTELWGDFDRRPFRPGSPRLLVAARRA
jgi:hypothetical protein